MNQLKRIIVEIFYGLNKSKDKPDSSKEYLSRQFIIDLIHKFKNKSGIHLISKHFQDSNIEIIIKELDELWSRVEISESQEDRLKILQDLENLGRRTYYQVLAIAAEHSQKDFYSNNITEQSRMNME